MGSSEITEENCKQALLDYMERNYARDFVVSQFKGYPYSIARFLPRLSKDHITKDMIEWFLLEWRNPKTRKTVLREFTENVEMRPEMKERMLQMEDLRFGEFTILENLGGTAKFEDEEGKELIVELNDPGSWKEYIPGRIVLGRIHPWGDGYRFAGIVTITNEDTLISIKVAEAAEMMVKEKERMEARKSKKSKSRNR